MHTPTRLHAALCAAFLAAALRAAEPAPIPVLCLAAWDTRSQGLTQIETNALAAYRGAGFALQLDYYEKVTPATLRRYPVVVGMLSQLHQGTSVFAGPFGGQLEDYLREGGSFLFFSGPSYYGTADFAEMQNPFLARFGAELLKEVPRNKDLEQAVTRILAYRYLRTEDIARTPYTTGAAALYLPLDFLDAYIRTHTMCLSEEWQILATAGRDTASYPHAAWLKGLHQPGRWRTSPPVLAVRHVGKGRFALFTTSSEYFIWEGGHRAFGDGFVLKNGGLQLMSSLLGQLAAESAFRGSSGEADKPEEEAPLPGLAVPVLLEKKAWYRTVLSRHLPAGYGVRSRIDCGALSDLPYTPKRERGYLGMPDGGDVLRSPGKDIYHPTAANARGVGDRPVTYRFSGLSAARRYTLGILLWSYDPSVGRDLAVTSGGTTNLFALPCLHRQQAPHFVNIPNISPDTAGCLDVTCARATGGAGIFSAVAELWLFESPAAETPDADLIAHRFDALDEGACVRFPQARLWKGLVGARSPVAGGDPVRALAHAAAQNGLSFLAYTDPAEAHTPESFAKLQSECAAASAPSCAVFAGLSFTDRYAADPAARAAMGMEGTVAGYVFQPVQTLPPSVDFGTPSALFWKFFGGAYSGGRAAPPTLTHPGKNGITPWHQRFWRGMDLATFGADGALLDDSRLLYTDLLAAGYGPQPRVSGVYRTASDIDTACAKGWLTLSAAPSPEAAATHPHATHATSGPLIRAFQWADDHFSAYGNGGGLVFGEPGWAILKAEVTHTASLARVTLFARRRPVRRWSPHDRSFTVTEPIRLQTASEYLLHAEAEDGSEAWSGRFQTVARAFATSMCADNQNTITTLFKAPSRHVHDERELYLQHAYWHTGEAAGQLGAMCDASQLVPRVDETGVLQPCKFFLPCPSLTFRDNSREDHRWAALRIEESTPDVARISYRYARTNAVFSSTTTLTAYRPAADGITAVFIETVLQARRAVAQEEIKRLVLVDLAVRPDFASPWRYTVLDGKGSEVLDGTFAQLGKGALQTAALGSGGIAAIWPNAIGNLLVAPCDPTLRHVTFSVLEQARTARERMTVHLPPRAFAEGESALFRHLVILAPEGAVSRGGLKHVQACMLSPILVPSLDRGTICENGPRLICRTAQAGDAVAGTFELPHETFGPVPLDICGVKPEWPVALERSGELRLLGADTETLHTVLDTPPGRIRFTAGNLLRADHPDVRIEIDSVTRRQIRYLVHNPTSKALTFTVSSNPAFTSLPAFRRTITLVPGATLWQNSDAR